MTKYLFKVNYTAEGTKGLLKEGGTARKTEVSRLFAEIGGKLEFFNYAFGGTDAYLIGDFPDPVSVAALVLMVAASGTAVGETVVLLAPEDIDAASKKTFSFRGAGQ